MNHFRRISIDLTKAIINPGRNIAMSVHAKMQFTREYDYGVH